MPFGVNSDARFRAQKLRTRVRVSSFRTTETVVFHCFFMVSHGVFIVLSWFVIAFSWFFIKLYFKELDFKELGVLGYLLGILSYLLDVLGCLLGVPI